MSNRNRCPRSAVSMVAKASIWLAAATLTAASPLFGYYLYLIEQWDSFQPPPAEAPDPNMFVVVSGIRMPPTKPADHAGLDDEAEVIGVCIDGSARAYAVESLGFPHHVINDVLHGHAVSVTYCDRRHCSRVFTAEGAANPLDVDLGGWKKDKGMLLHIKGVHYAQETSENLTTVDGASLPYPELPHVRTTWGAWRKVHPDTDVYVGQKPIS